MQAANRSLEAEVADRKLAEALLTRSEQRFRALAESTTDWVWECDDRGVYTYASPKVRELLGYESAEVVGRTRWDLMPPEETIVSGAEVAAAIVAREPFTRIEAPTARRDGQVVVLETSGVPFFDATGRFLGYRGIDRDVTQRKLDEEQIARTMTELARSNADLEQFAHIASHDLQEPLRKIMAFGDRLQSKYDAALDEVGRDYVQRMRSAAQRMQLLIQGLLSYSRVTTRAHLMQQVDLTRIADEVVQDFEVRIEQVQGHVEVGALPTIDADPTQMRQLLQNLVGNALKFHRPGVAPVVEIGAERTTQPGHLAAEERHDTGWWVVRVRDNGIGFDPRHIDRIFGIFQRLHGRDEYDGTGVGLAVCRKIARRHGGEITASSAPGAGATFLITLPEHQAEAERASDGGTA
jgi:PAS domain S-box-containing protein